VTISYYGIPLPLPPLSTCVPLSAAAATSLVLPVKVVVDSVGTASAGTASDKQNVEAVLHMTFGAAARDKCAIFPGSEFSPSNGVTIGRTPSGPPADVYVRGPVNCANQTAIDGTLVSTQGMNLANTCTVDGAAWTARSMRMTNNSLVTGDVTVASGGGTGDLTLTNSASVVGNALTGGNVTLFNAASVGGNVNEDSSAAPQPPASRSRPSLSRPPRGSLPAIAS
jgi:hypothetical protein